MRGDKTEAHQISRVIFGMKGHEVLPDIYTQSIGHGGQRMLRTDGKSAERMLGISTSHENLIGPPAITLDITLKLALYSVQLALSGAVSEQRGDKKLCKAIQSFPELELAGLCDHSEMEIGVLVSGVGVGRAAVFREKLLVALLVGVAAGAEEEHVLEEVGEAGEICRVGAGADGDIHGGGGAFGEVVRDEEDAEGV